MKIGVSPLERAFQLAGSGTITNLSDIRKALKSEGYHDDELQGNVLLKQLREAVKAAREKASMKAIRVEDLNASNDK